MQTFKRKIEKYETVDAMQFIGNYNQIAKIVKMFDAKHVSMDVSNNKIKTLRVSKDGYHNDAIINQLDYIVIAHTDGIDQLSVQTNHEFESKFGTEQQKNAAHKFFIFQLLLNYVKNKHFTVKYQDEFTIEYDVKDARWFAKTLVEINRNVYLQKWDEYPDNSTEKDEMIDMYVKNAIIRYLNQNKILHINGTQHYSMDSEQLIWPEKYN